jgi:1,4-alpha-glucan branching enzyme
MPRGLIAFVLHAHLPYVRHLEQWELVEERWFHEAVADAYLPLIDMLFHLVDEGIEPHLTLSISPTLASMLSDPALTLRTEEYLGAQVELLEDETARSNREGDEARSEVLCFYQKRLERLTGLRRALGGDLIEALGALEEAGAVELMTSAATHAYLPLIEAIPGALESQIRLGLECHSRLFGRRPAGFWLPECGWEPSLESALRHAGVRYLVVETHGLTHAEPQPPFGVRAPLLTPGGLAAFGRDPECSKQIWSATEGYPADPVYREFFRDLGWERPAAELGRLRPPPEGEPLPTGLKLHRITGPTQAKELYRPAEAAARAREHARHFVESRLNQAEEARQDMDRPPLMVAPFDAELFGHWWFEGPLFLEEVIRRIDGDPDGLELITLGEDLARWPRVRRAMPAASSWGEGGSSEVWLSGDALWIHRRLHALGRRLAEARRTSEEADGLQRRALAQATREHLMAQASDWPFLVRAATARAYAEGRAERHLSRTAELLDRLERKEIDEEVLGRFEEECPIFPWLDPSVADDDSH